MLKVNPEFSPIFDTFIALVRDNETKKLMAMWQDTIAKGQITFFRRIELASGLVLQFRIHTELHPVLDRARSKIVLDPSLEIAAIFCRPGLKNKNFTYFDDELVIAKGSGKWDYVDNTRFKTLRLSRNLTVNATKGPDGKPLPEELSSNVRMVSEVCRHWLVNSQLRRTLEKKATRAAAAAPTLPEPPAA